MLTREDIITDEYLQVEQAEEKDWGESFLKKGFDISLDIDSPISANCCPRRKNTKMVS
jgi:hypothetical protein